MQTTWTVPDLVVRFHAAVLMVNVVISVVYWLACLSLNPRFTGSNPAEVMDF
jgi:hypothetical protein